MAVAIVAVGVVVGVVMSVAAGSGRALRVWTVVADSGSGHCVGGGRREAFHLHRREAQEPVEV